MNHLRTRALWGTAAAAGLVAAAAWAVTQPPATPPGKLDLGSLKPKWQVGDSWVVETVTRPVAARVGPAAAAPDPKPTQWKFTVRGKETLKAVVDDKPVANECFVVEVTTLPEARGQPVTKLWLDTGSLALRQSAEPKYLGGEVTLVVENYQSKGPGTPVITQSTAIPLDLPVFIPGARAGELSFTYDAVSGPAGIKRAAGDVGFATDIKQKISETPPDAVRGLVAPPLARGLTPGQLVTVDLSTAERKVTQVWQVGQPWPLYTKTGATTARLVSATPAAKNPAPNE